MRKKLLVVALAVVTITNLVACSVSKKENVQKEDAPNMEYEGTYEFPDVVSVAHCYTCDEDYKSYGWDYEEVIKMSDLGDKGYSTIAFTKDGYEYLYPMVINGKEMEFVYTNMSSVPKSVKDTKYKDSKTIYEYEDDDVVICIMKSKEASICEGRLFDKTRTFTDVNGEECVYLDITDYDNDITVEDLITALNAFDYTIIKEDDGNKHLHILPKVKE